VLVAQIMSAGAVTTHPETSAQAALQELSDRSFTALPVVDANGHLMGIISEVDLLRAGIVRDTRATVLPGAPGNGHAHALDSRTTVGDVMTRHVISATPAQEVASVVSVMLEHAIRSVPVVLGSRVVGMLSRSEVVRALARPDGQIADETTALLEDAGLAGWHCAVDDGRVRLAGPVYDAATAERLAKRVAGVRSVVVEGA
jgi:CBS domain-containing protein